MSLKELVKEIIESYGRDIEYPLFHSYISEDVTQWSDDKEKQFHWELERNGISIKPEDRFGGEGMGEDYWSVYSFTKDNEKVFAKFDGYYASYSGSEYSQWFFVETFEKTVTDYREI